MRRPLPLLALFICSMSALVIRIEPGNVGIVGGQPVATGDGSIEGIVINEITREPIRKAQVTSGMGNVPPAITDGSGHFAFRNLLPGTYWMQAQHPEFIYAQPNPMVA